MLVSMSRAKNRPRYGVDFLFLDCKYSACVHEPEASRWRKRRSNRGRLRRAGLYCLLSVRDEVVILIYVR
jgi:hypothetical protein